MTSPFGTKEITLIVVLAVVLLVLVRKVINRNHPRLAPLSITSVIIAHALLSLTFSQPLLHILST